MKEAKGIKMSYLPVIKNSHGNVKYSTGEIVNNAVMTMYGARWVLDLLG